MVIQFYFQELGKKKWHYCHGVWGRPVRTMVAYWETDKLTGVQHEVVRDVKFHADGKKGDKLKIKYAKGDGNEN